MLTTLQSWVLNIFEKHRFLFILIFITFLIRLPSLFEPFWYGDEAIYLVIGQKILRGGLLYVDIFDHKTPGIYYLAAATIAFLGQTIWSFRFLLMVWTLTALVVFFFLSKKLFDEKIARLATIFLAALTSTPLLEGNIGNSEILMMLPISLGLIYGLNKKFFWSGVFFSLSFLLKFPAIFDFGAFFIFLTLGANRKNVFPTIKNLFSLTAGYLLPIALSVIYFAWNGALSAYLFSALLFNFAYTNYGNKLILAGVNVPNGLILLKATPLFALVIYLFLRLYKNFKSRSARTSVNYLEFIILWLSFSYFGAVFGGRPYPHYLIQALPAFAILLAIGVTKVKRHPLALGLSTFFVVLTLILGFKPYIRPNYYPNFFRYLLPKQLGQISTEDYMNSFDSKIARNYSLAGFVETRTTSADNVYIWGNSPVIYFLSRRDPTSKYITAFHVAGSQLFKKEVIASINTRHPKYILVESSSPKFAELDNVLARSYNLFAQTDDVKIYQRLGVFTAD
ncbi:MAG: hypothetical protein A3F35_01635 [Candidatus Woykebacteria bacterium RIFCSPHIGHO2_12_FULL_45_10]|uniref:Glycosyltransferase RgtA/B/C/D-like domain-containing protein n=1 Tax=Candidatus Woykebacteria bacterium RIFCSPHIGHO2_12_FULL_45_10 TaxID=1802603 RepID=A0A1G1WNB9_9BACT|nr:MAG: hypothetical protein A3F35_01635 [Candidatus Woykebacteria bacterium RIFCSPHIGHO2_12_FULL_45_10]